MKPRPVVHHGDCLDVLRDMPDASVHAVVTDPPYGLANTTPQQVADTLVRWVNGDRDYIPSGAGFMGKAWDAFVPPVAVWDECLRVLKPGGHLLAFAGSRTFDLMGLGIRLAGFDIRDSIAWLHAQGFPKSLDVFKAIDRQRDDLADVHQVCAFVAEYRQRAGVSNRQVDALFGFNGMAGHWTNSSGPQAQVPKVEQWGRLKEYLSLPDDMDAEVWRLNGRKGSPGEAWERREVVGSASVPVGHAFVGSTYGGDSSGRVVDLTAPATPDAEKWQGWGTALKPAFEPVVVARKPLAGTVAGNVLAHGTGALNIDATRVEGAVPQVTQGLSSAPSSWEPRTERRLSNPHAAGRWPANVVLDESQAAALDQQSGERPSSGGAAFETGGYGGTVGLNRNDRREIGFGDTGGASRFFPTFKYEPKAPADERPRINGVAHPTVKPLDLMRWLVRLVTPPGGTVLDPFAGTGTTLEAAMLEGFASIGIERDDDHLPLIRQRLDRHLNPAAYLRNKAPAGEEPDLGLLGLLDGEDTA